MMISGVGKLRELKNNKAFQSSKNVFQHINLGEKITDISNIILEEKKIEKLDTEKIVENSNFQEDSDSDSELEYNIKGFCILS